MGSQAEPFVKAYGGIVSEGRDDQTGLVSFDGFDDETASVGGVFFIEVAEGFVQKKKLEGFAQCTQ